MCLNDNALQLKILPLSILAAASSGVINRHYLTYADAGQHSELRLEEFVQTSLFHYSFEWKKNLSIQSPCDFVSGLDSINPNWF